MQQRGVHRLIFDGDELPAPQLLESFLEGVRGNVELFQAVVELVPGRKHMAVVDRLADEVQHPALHATNVIGSFAEKHL